MNEFLAAWALCMTAACFVIAGVVTVLDIRDYRRSKAGRLVVAKRDRAPAPTPEQRQPASAAAIVAVHDPAAFEEFLAELILTTHVEDVIR
jgi:hypothetical protein